MSELERATLVRLLRGGPVAVRLFLDAIDQVGVTINLPLRLHGRGQCSLRLDELARRDLATLERAIGARRAA